MWLISNNRIFTRKLPKKNKDNTCALDGCDNKLEGKRKKWCSDICSWLWGMENGWQGVRLLVFARDQGKCKKCGVLLRMADNSSNWYYVGCDFPDGLVFKNTTWDYKLFERNIKDPKLFPKIQPQNDFHNFRETNIDHITPVAEGGDSLAMDNLQTLCVPCHKQKTAKDLRRMFTKVEKSENNESNTKAKQSTIHDFL